MRNVRLFVLSVVAMLTAVSFAASPLTDADKFYAGKKWIDAAKAYEAFASGKSGGRDCWRARLRAALAREKAGDRKNSLSGADRVIRGAAGRAQDDLVGEAFLLKQRLLFHAKSKTGPRDSLLKGAVARLGWNVHVSRLYENEAVRRIREGDADAAWRLCSNSRIVLSPAGSNIVAVLSFARTKGTGGVKSDEAIKILSALHASDRQTATALIDLARTSTTGAARIDLTCAAAELSAATGDGKRACRLYEELLSGALSHAQRQRLRLRYAGYLKSSGQDERGAEIYADWAKDIKPGEPYSAGMKQYVGFLMERHRYRAAKDVLDKFCGERSGVYASTERKAVLQKIEVGIASGDEDSEVQAGWKMLSDADGLAKSKRHGDAMKLYRAIATRYAGDLRTEALFHLGNCLCGIAKYSQAAETWDPLTETVDVHRWRCCARGCFALDR